MKSIRDAQLAMLARFQPREPEQRALLDALGAVSHGDVLAGRDLPPFDNSAMDGYAVACDEAPLGAELPVRGEARAAASEGQTLSPGSAMRIFTGAPLPAGADSVVMQENVERDGERIRILQAPRRGEHVRARGSDLATGALALPHGSRLGPGEIGLLAAQGLASVTVHRSPRVAIVCTGDELRELGSTPEPGTIFNSNAHALSAQVRQAGGAPRVLPIAADDPASIAERLTDALRDDVVLSVGGVSVGDHDHVAEAFERAGVETLFWKVAIKPGKPLRFGVGGGVPVVGLPGNPISAMVVFELFVRPGLARMQGLTAPFPTPLPVHLGHAHQHSPGRTELARATLSRQGDRLEVRMDRLQGSGSLPSMVGVHVLVVLPAGQERFEAGSLLDAFALEPLPLRDGPLD